MISVNNICVQFSGVELFKGISFVVNKKDRIGLVGKNGVGKSTLMKIITGNQTPETGSVVVPEGMSVGYLPQEIKSSSTKTIYDETLSVFDHLKVLEEEIEQINQELEQRTDYESDSYASLIDKLTEKHEELNLAGGEKAAGEAEKILKGLGFKPEDLQRSISEFSGGWQMRVELAKLLLKSPTLLLLDEPTNHLDIESIIWLEDTLKNYPGSIMMISHDRMFLDNLTNRTIEIVFGKTHDYKVAYSKYFELREERLSQQRAAYENQQSYIAQQERFIERFKAKASKAKAAQSKQKQLDKIERIEFDELDTSSIQFRFPPAPRSGQVVVNGEQVGKRYDEKVILKGLDFKILRGDRMAFVGQNGQGKTTLVKMIMGHEPAEGNLEIGHNVDIGYYAQVQEGTLKLDRTVYQTIEDVATGEWAKIHKIRGLLGAFLFGPDDIDKKVKVLSGGEKSRLALARLLLHPYNLLILDEPTNHLDIASKEVLKNALISYDGTLIIVSHDREFLQDLTNRTFEFKNKKIKEHIGEISEFLDAHQLETFREFEMGTDKAEAAKKEKKGDASYAMSKEQQKQLNKTKNALKKAEETIARLEGEIAAFDARMADPEQYKDLLNDKSAFDQQDKRKKQLEKEMESWEALSLELEELES